MHHAKQSLRTSIQSVTKNIPPDERRESATKLWERVEARDDFLSAQTVLLYRSLDDEVWTHDFIRKWQDQKTIVLPCIHDDILVLKRFEWEETMKIGQHFSLAEAQGEIIAYNSLDLAFIPGVAFDSQGNRLGRGKGYYDRLLPHLHCPKIGICYDRQVVDSIPIEEHDVGVDELIIG